MNLKHFLHLKRKNSKTQNPPSIQYTTDHWLSNDTNVTDNRKIFVPNPSQMSLQYILINTIIYNNKS